MIIESNSLKSYIQERKKWMAQFFNGKYAIKELELMEAKITELEHDPLTDTNFDATIYDKEETITHCTVQILTNTYTGDISVGWWKESAEEIRME